MSITAKHQVYTYQFKIDQKAALSMLNLPIDLKFTSLDSMIDFLRKVKITSNSVNFSSEPELAEERELSSNENRAICEQVYQTNSKIYKEFKNTDFDFDETDVAFWAIESSMLIRNRYQYHSKIIKCLIDGFVYKFYFDIKKTFNW